MFDAEGAAPQSALYSSSFEHDACGIGAYVSIRGIRSRKTVEGALRIVESLDHRAGRDADGTTGDGVGLLTQIPHEFFARVTAPLGIALGSARDYGVGMFFFPQNELKRSRARKLFEIIAAKEGIEFLGWREVPVRRGVISARALACMPCIMQAFLRRPLDAAQGIDFDRRLYIVRRIFEQSSDDTYVVSLSSRTIIYKGMFLVHQLRTFFPDLEAEDFISAIGVVHSRFSTNTNPSWERAHPYRLIVHNGEINTIRGNIDKMQAREENMQSEQLRDQLGKVLPAVHPGGSDSAMLDNTLEFLVMSGMELPLAVMMMIPEPWENSRTMSQQRKDFYQYYATMMEPWDGPASILFTDGDMVGAVLDRNGLRPSRYLITDDDTLILSSETGVLDIDPAHIRVKERLHPGKMLLVDTASGRVIGDDEIKDRYASRQPYGEWLDSHLVTLKELKIPNQLIPVHEPTELHRLQKAFGYTYEELRTGILPLAMTGAEPSAAMGADIPLPFLSRFPHPLFDSFRQLFAQVTNPPIDAIREKIVTSSTVYAGREGNVLQETPDNCTVLKIRNPILSDTDLLKIRNMHHQGFQVSEIAITYYKNTSLEAALERLFVDADRNFSQGSNILILTDRGVDENHVAIPSLLAVSALNQHLVMTRKRTAVSLILESGEPRLVHHFATLLGFGATAVNPYLAHETVKELIDSHLLAKDLHAAIEDYDQAILAGIIKIASKMGISSVQSYEGSKIFEAMGIDHEVIDRYFSGTVCRIGGLSLKDIEEQTDHLHSSAFDPLGLGTDAELESPGWHQMHSGGEDHLYDPQVIHALQEAVRRDDYSLYQQYSALVNDPGRIHHLRSLLQFTPQADPIPLAEVESVDSIVTRFKTGAMSYGSISDEAHSAIAIAMNRMHARSNTGEGGEEEERLVPGPADNNRCSAIKQVASGRFGVTSAYLCSASEIQIKMAQGAKPGEGGQLPGSKVYPWIARTRHSTPGVTLISPPPHHDIYSIEDLAQLIYDLKNANRSARISVKLVSEAGVGTVAAGVAKAGAQVVLISGYDGGTGAAPRSSIYHAGMPWELGVAETHQTLLQNGLRHKVRIETDGKLMTGRDVAVAAMLGAEEFGFATAPLISLGCLMMRVCNLDTCPVGIATQNPQLRQRFRGRPEYVMRFMRFTAMELREIMASLGIRTVDELVGRSDLLSVRSDLPEKAALQDLSAILKAAPHDASGSRPVFDPASAYDFHLERTLDERVLLKQLADSLKTGKKADLSLEVRNTDRAFGTILGSEITRAFGSSLDENTITLHCQGSGGQSFGAFIPRGLTIELTGDSNDYLGKGLSGGTLVVKPPRERGFRAEDNILIGNVALYGATSGSAFLNGIAGERFCVRNSGAEAVVEGVGDHGCEYMTGGCVLILGEVGRNFAAGMSGGIAYVLDERGDLYTKINKQMVSSCQVSDRHDVLQLRQLLERHAAATGSEKAARILADFDGYLGQFRKIVPHDYARMMKLFADMEARGMSPEEARMEAFYAARGQR